MANGEDGRDGTDDNRSWNCGAEGATDDADVAGLRRRQVRNFLTTLFVSQGVPMLLGGDELGRTQQGNNNAYCQDNDISWYDWDAVDDDLLAWTGAVVALRRAHPVFRRRRFFQGRPVRGSGGRGQLPDIGWFRPDGGEMTDKDWRVGYAKSLGVFLNGQAIPDPDDLGRPVADDSFYLLFNAWDQPLGFTLPAPRWGRAWTVVLDTAADRPLPGPGPTYRARQVLSLAGHHVVALQRRSEL